MALLRTIPGIWLITAITFLTVIESIERSESMDHFAGFLSLIPNRHSSEEKDKNGEMTFWGSDALKKLQIESSCIAVRLDPALNMS